MQRLASERTSLQPIDEAPTAGLSSASERRAQSRFFFFFVVVVIIFGNGKIDLNDDWCGLAA